MCVATVKRDRFAREQHAIYFKGPSLHRHARKDNFLQAALKRRPLCFPWMKRAGSQDPVRPWVDVNSIWMLGDIFEMRIAGAAEFYGYN